MKTFANIFRDYFSFSQSPPVFFLLIQIILKDNFSKYLSFFCFRQRRRVRRNLGFLSEKGVDENQPCGNQTVYHAKRLNHYSNNLLVESQEKNNFPTLIIAGVPFQVVRRESANLSDRTETTSAPIYETIEDTQYIGGEERVYAQLENLCDNKCECVPRNEKIGTINLQNSFRQVKSGQQLNPYIHSVSSSNLGHEDTYSLQYSEPIGGIRPSPGHRLVQVRGDPAEVLQVYMKRRELENSSGFQSIRRGRVPGKAPTLSRFKPGSSLT